MKLIMMRGLPASGKSTYAKELMAKDGAYVRVNKDLLREMMHFGTYSPTNESLIKAAEVEIVEMALSMGQTVIVDDTNLGQKYEDQWKHLAELWEVPFEIYDLHVLVSDCIQRDSERNNSVGADVIRKMADQHGYG